MGRDPIWEGRRHDCGDDNLLLHPLPELQYGAKRVECVREPQGSLQRLRGPPRPAKVCYTEEQKEHILRTYLECGRM
jgi:hypothetical protein